MIREVLFAGAAAGAGLSLASILTAPDPASSCGYGFTPVGPSCVAADGCPAPLAVVDGRCRAPDTRIRIAEATVLVGPADWEAEGRVAPHTIHTRAFAIDAFELTTDDARAKGALSRTEAATLCSARGGRLPTDDEWTVAAAGVEPRRYPWGPTGAVCRRGSWGLEDGPCAHDARAPDTVGSHTDGDTPSGLHDMAGNVAEWVADGSGAVRGGSFHSTLAADLRTWARIDLDPESHEAWVGARCAYDETAPN